MFAKIRNILRVIRKLSLKEDVERKPDFSFFKE
jgi:hypothetical protein